MSKASKFKMSKKLNHTDYYTNSIIDDVRTRFVSEETTKYTGSEIVRIYEFDDGAVVKYEWREAPRGEVSDSFNHRFTIVKPPRPNPHKLKKGVIKVIDHSG